MRTTRMHMQHPACCYLHKCRQFVDFQIQQGYKWQAQSLRPISMEANPEEGQSNMQSKNTNMTPQWCSQCNAKAQNDTPATKA